MGGRPDVPRQAGAGSEQTQAVSTLKCSPVHDVRMRSLSAPHVGHSIELGSSSGGSSHFSLSTAWYEGKEACISAPRCAVLSAAPCRSSETAARRAAATCLRATCAVPTCSHACLCCGSDGSSDFFFPFFGIPRPVLLGYAPPRGQQRSSTRHAPRERPRPDQHTEDTQTCPQQSRLRRKRVAGPSDGLFTPPAWRTAARRVKNANVPGFPRQDAAVVSRVAVL